MPIVTTSTATLASVIASGVAAAPASTQAPRPTSSMSAPCASMLGTAGSRLAGGVPEARDDVGRGGEDFAPRRFLAGDPAHQLERRAVQRSGELLFAAERRQGPTQRADSCSVFRHRLRINARADRALTTKKGNHWP